MTTYVQAVTDFVVLHPHWASLLVFLTAAAEAIAVIGSIVPGTAVLIGVGAVAGLGHLPLCSMGLRPRLWGGKNSEELGTDGSDGQAHGAPLGGAEFDVHGRRYRRA